MRGLLSAPRDMLRNLGLLSLGWVCVTLIQMMMVSITILVGHQLAETKSLAALPIAMQWLAVALSTVPASFLMQRIGRRAGFLLAAGIIAVGGGLALIAVYDSDFALFCVSTFLVGMGSAANWYYRFAGAEVVSEEFRSRAISLVLAGGVGAAVLGPSLAVWSKDLLAPVPFAGTFVAIIVLNFVIAILLSFVDIPRPAVQELKGGRPLREIARQPMFRVAVVGGVASYAVMVLMMSVTPLAMAQCGLPFDDAAFVIQWHVLGMYVPSFFTGQLIRRFGTLQIMITGALLLIAASAIAAMGITLVHFWLSLGLLGIGWNFLFIGSTSLLTETYRTSERAKAQGLNDFLIFSMVGVGVLSSGHLLDAMGWTAVALSVLPFVLVVLMAVAYLARARARAAV